jgi:hypothetical protein
MTLGSTPAGVPMDGGGQIEALWADLVRSALAGTVPASAEAVRTEPVPALAAVIDDRAGDPSYDGTVLRSLVAVLHGLGRPGGDVVTEGRRRVSHLVGSLRPATISRLLRSSPSDGQRRSVVLEAAEVLDPRATMVLLGGAAHAAGQPLPRPLIRLLWKLGARAAGGSNGGEEDPGGRAFRDQIRRLVARWWIVSGQEFGSSVADGGDEPFSRPGEHESLPGELVPEPERIVRISLRVDTTGPGLWAPLRTLSGGGGGRQVLELLREAPAGSAVARSIAQDVCSPALLREVLREDSPDFELLDVLVDALGMATADALLDTLTEAESRATRRGLLSRLVRLGTPVASLAAERLTDPRWFVQRNILAILRELELWPEGTAVEPFLAHDDARVRREAVQLLADIPEFQDRAIIAALRDPDWKVVRFGIYAAGKEFREGWVPLLARRMAQPDFPAELCLPAIGVLASSARPEALERLMALAVDGRTLLRAPRLRPASPVMLRALAVLARRWGEDRRVAAVLKEAGRSREQAVRDAAAAGAGGGDA